MQATKTHFSRMLAALLILVMLFGIFSVSAGAANIDNVRHYDTYVCLGDSIAAGYGPDNKNAYGLVPVDFAYHSLVANAVTADTFYQMARPGGRTSEIRYFLEPEAAYDKSLFIIPLEEQDAETLKQTYLKTVSEADLITLNVGSNDVITQSLGQVLAVINNTEPTPDAIQDFIEKSGGIGQALQRLLNLAKTLGKLNTAATTFVQSLSDSMRDFQTNWDALCKDIYTLNPDVTLVAVGYFNPLPSLRLKEESSIEIGKAVDAIVAMMNVYVRSTSVWAKQYHYANVYGTECYELPPMSDENFGTEMVADVHPTHAGHAFMAEQIVKVLPERDSNPDPKPDPQPAKAFPFTDVKQGTWYYDYVYYVWDNGIMDGMTDTTFAPNAKTTRAQFATVLYRLANKPAVSDADRADCPFTDLKADWYRDAVIWAFSKGVVEGVSDTAFDPTAEITREQMVTMLYRYSGETVKNTDLSAFTDNAAISAYARDAVAWAVENGIVDGMDNNTFQPKGTATRAQLATILSRYMTR